MPMVGESAQCKSPLESVGLENNRPIFKRITRILRDARVFRDRVGDGTAGYYSNEIEHTNKA